jgi:hypothetical protein
MEPETLCPTETSKPAYSRSISDEQKTGFRPAVPTYYDPVTHSNVNDRIQQVRPQKSIFLTCFCS